VFAFYDRGLIHGRVESSKPQGLGLRSSRHRPEQARLAF
jgi:hypothetical protein